MTDYKTILDKIYLTREHIYEETKDMLLEEKIQYTQNKTQGLIDRYDLNKYCLSVPVVA